MTPNFIIIGAAKCGTTALASILGSHPDCCMSQPKEVSFFQDTMDFETNPNYEKGWDWYKQFFKHYNGEKLIGEATPSYSDRTRSPNTAKRIFEFNPNMKLIYMVRNPLDRQISSWKMQWYENKNNLWPNRIETSWAGKGFQFWLDKQKEVKQWDVNRYTYNLNAFKEYFPPNQIYVSFLEDWRVNQEREVNRIFEFLGLYKNIPTESKKKIENTKEARKETSTVFKLIRNLSVQLKLSKIVNKNFKKNIIDKFSKDIEYPTINDHDLDEFKDYIREDSYEFLETYGKDKTYWKI